MNQVLTWIFNLMAALMLIRQLSQLASRRRKTPGAIEPPLQVEAARLRELVNSRVATLRAAGWTVDVTANGLGYRASEP